MYISFVGILMGSMLSQLLEKSEYKFLMIKKKIHYTENLACKKKNQGAPLEPGLANL